MEKVSGEEGERGKVKSLGRWGREVRRGGVRRGERERWVKEYRYQIRDINSEVCFRGRQNHELETCSAAP